MQAIQFYMTNKKGSKNMNKNTKFAKLFDEAKKRAKKRYEEETTIGAWDDADKYEKEDYVFYELQQMQKNN